MVQRRRGAARVIHLLIPWRNKRGCFIPPYLSRDSGRERRERDSRMGDREYQDMRDQEGRQGTDMRIFIINVD